MKKFPLGTRSPECYKLRLFMIKALYSFLFLLLFTVLSPVAGLGAEEQPFSDQREMTLLEAVILGVVEGLTEYLPVSSTGHLLLAQRAMDIPEDEASNAYAVCIQLGAILAVLGLYRKRVMQTVKGLLGQDADGRQLLVNLVLAFVPAAVVGLLFDDAIEYYLFGLWPTVLAWGVGGLAILTVVWMRRQNLPPEGEPLEALRWKGALLIGCIQCLAMWPGVSRSLVTIVGGLIAGLGLGAAVEFSFLLGVLTLTAATVYKGLQFGPEILAAYGALPVFAGAVAALISALMAVKWMVAYLKKHGLALFGWYRIALAGAVTIFLLLGWMEP